ncbi:replication initiator protein [Apis mellifera associated microvirus 5]|nr:replication initiator protein [Apis mellifera associated microvirus 5]AZL82839.1 replication initiator protein [Apis mellifera associated microvirus 5]
MCSSPWTRPDGGPVKCGQCMECRLAYSREWAIRISHESRMHDRCCFLTLTYDDVNLPRHGQLVKRDLQLFFKRLRKVTGPFRYVASGEYGELKRRPHFHVALFGIDFSSDRIEYGEGIRGDKIYVSATVASVWGKSVFPMGHTIGSLTFESAAYIARYITKKITGVGASPKPLACDPETGEMVMPNPEFLLCSKGIGRAWFRDYFMQDVYPHARVITDQGSPAPVPRYYKSLLKELGSDLAFNMSARTTARLYDDLNRRISEDMPARRAARSVYAKARTGVFKRDVKD